MPGPTDMVLITDSEPRTVEITIQRCMNVSPDLALGVIEKKRDYYIEVTLGSETKKTKNCRRLNQQLDWNEKLVFDNVNTSSVTFSLYCHRTLRDPKLVQQLTYQISDSAGDVAPPSTVQTVSFSNGPQIEFNLKTIAPLISRKEIEPSTEVYEVQLQARVKETEFEAAAAITVPQPAADRKTSERITIEDMKSHDETGETEPPVVRDEAVEQAKQALESQHNLKDGWKRLLEGIESFRDIVGSVAEAHPYAKLAHSLFFAIPTSLIEQLELDEGVKTLFDSFVSFCDIVNELKASTLGGVGELEDVLKRISLQMTELAYFVRDYCKEESFLKKVLKNKLSGISDAIQDYCTKLGELKDEFQNRLQLQTAISVASTGAAVANMGAIVERTEIKIIRVFKELETINQSIDLNDIPYVTGAGLNTDKRCLGGTRENFLEEIEEWVNSDGSRTLLISGGAGTGKSSIAQTIAARFRELGRLGSVFCFSEDEKATRKPTTLFPHIARDLADLDPHIRVELAKAAQDKVDRTTSGITAQFEKLILIPANAIREHLRGPIVIVVDALDESGPVAEREALLKVLADRLKELPPNFRFIITSRPDPDIEHGLKPGPSIFSKRMDTIPSEHTAADIVTYVRSQFADNRYRDIDHEKCDTLASHANGLFQWASVACKFIRAESAGDTALDRYEELIEPLARDDGDALAGDSLLDYLYHIVLSKALSPRNRTAMAKFKFVMARVLTAFEPLSSKSLNKFVVASKVAPKNCSVESVVKYLGSLLSGVYDPDTPIRPLHTSFRNFLADSSRSKEFAIDLGTPDVHSDMTLVSMQIMNNELTFNICHLETSYLPNKKVPGIEDLIKKHIPRHLSYACRFWAAHFLSLRVTNSSGSDAKSSATINRRDEILKEVDQLLSNRLLYCLEVLSFECAADPALKQIRGICVWLKEITMDEKIILLFEDVGRFFSYFAKCIATSVPHIYVSALPFTPRGSLVAKNYAQRCDRTLALESGQLETYPSWPNILHGHTSAVCSVYFSPDGTRIVSGSDDNTIRVWDLENGEVVIGPLQGHTSPVRSVAFSSDGTRIASGSADNTIHVWDAENGELVIGPLQGHTHWVNSVRFSPDGTRVVSGSVDTTIRVWNAESGEMVIGPLQGHTGSVNSVGFSPDGTRIVSGSSDNTIRVWNAENGKMLIRPLRGHTRLVRSVEFSPDGTRIVSGSDDNTIRVWNAKDGQILIGPLQDHNDWVMSVGFSPDGTRIVSGSRDDTIRVWDAESGVMVVGPLQGHANSVNSVGFSPDGTRIASGSSDNNIQLWKAERTEDDGTRIISGSGDNTVRVWDVKSGEMVTRPLQGHTGGIISVGFSPDGTRIVSGSIDSTIRVWDAENSEMVIGPLQGHTGTVLSVGFSPDSTRIVSGSTDNTIRVWNVENGEMILGPLRGHKSWVKSVRFSSCGTRIVSGSEDKTIRVWNATSGETVIGPLQGHTDEVNSVTFSPDGTRIVSGSNDNTIRVWNAENGEIVVGPLQGHTGKVHSVGFSPNGTFIVSSSYDNTIRVWNAESGEMVIGPLQGHTSAVLSVEFSPDSTRIVSGSDDKTVRVQTNDLSLPASLDDCDHAQQIIPQNYWRMEDGWSLGPNGELLFYVPPAHRARFYHPQTIAIISTEISTKLDVSAFAHGTRWTECFNADAMSNSHD